MTGHIGSIDPREPVEELLRLAPTFSHDLSFPRPEEIRVYDDTLRDGEQMPGVSFSPATKYELARQLSDIGVHVMDVGFPAVSTTERETLARVLQGRAAGELRPDLEILCMMRANVDDIRSTMRVMDDLGHGRDCVTYLIFTSTSDLHVKYKLGRMLLAREGVDLDRWLDSPVDFYREANIRMVRDAIRYAREQGAESVEFGAEDCSRADADYMVRLYSAALEAGASRTVFTDTVGCCSPHAAREYVSTLKRATPDDPLAVHFHNDLALGAWNSVVGLGSGAEFFTSTVNGIGERSGNAAMHQVLMQLRYLFDIEIPGFRYNRLLRLSRRLERVSGIPVPPTEPGVGFNAFSHESGIHTAGMLIHPLIYQFVSPEDVGGRIRYVYGKHSGALIVAHALQEAGLEPVPERLQRVTDEVKRRQETKAEHNDFSQFHDRYYGHLERMGLTADEVVRIAIELEPDLAVGIGQEARRGRS